MDITTSNSLVRLQPKENKLIWVLGSIFVLYWVYGYFNCIDRKDWIIENLLVVICLAILVFTWKWHRLSDLSYICIFLFVILHLYGAFYAYTQNALGAWLQSKFHLWRNPYDRIVHFSFGLLLAYPFREILLRKFNIRGKASWLLPVEVAFSFGTIFEMIEWGVSAITTKETGETYVATQGDVWDAHKDIALAALGAATTMLITYLLHNKRKSSVKK
jgi:putative membrane protein